MKGPYELSDARWAELRANPWLLPPADYTRPAQRFIGMQLCLWDPAPLGEWGQLWLPVCLYCLRGPLSEAQVTCGQCQHGWKVGTGWVP
jgi:hypothetical protein